MHNNQIPRIPLKEKYKKIIKNLSFILVEPEVEGNVGASARALKTSGFENLVLVNPQTDITRPEVQWMAHRSEDILQNVKVVPTLTDAIKDMRLVVATTQRRRHFKFPIYTPEEISEKIEAVAESHPVAIVFGREGTGLSNRELLQCHIHSTIHTATREPSLNLAQSVMIYANTFFRMQNIKQAVQTYDLATQYELEKFYEHLQLSIKKAKFVPRDSYDDFITRFKRLLGRSLAEKRDVRLMHKLLQIYEDRIDKLEREVSFLKKESE